MDGRLPAKAGLFVFALMLSCAAPLHAAPLDPPPAAPASVPPVAPAPPAAPATAAARAAETADRVAENNARAKAQIQKLKEQLEQRLHPTPDQRQQQFAEYQRTAPEREARKRLQDAEPKLDGPELDVREALYAQGRALIQLQRRSDAVVVYRDYVAQRRRTPSGLWMSESFYLGVESALLESVPKDEEARRWDWLEKETSRWAREAPDSPLPRLLHAEMLLGRAWEIRGTRYAAKTPAEVWKPFYAAIERTLKYLDRERAIASGAPEYYKLSLDAMRGSENGGAPLAVLDQGERAFPGYYPMYFAMYTTLLPKWSGSVAQIEAFAADAVRRTHASEGESMYARIYWFAAQGAYSKTLFWRTYANWERMKEGFDDVVQRYPDQWNLHNYARFACDAQDRETLTKLLPKLKIQGNMQMLESAWGSRKHFEECGEMAGRVRL